MSIEVDRNIVKNLTAYTAKGKITVNDFIYEVKKFYERNPTENVLWNLLDADLWGLNAKDMESISSSTLSYKSDYIRIKVAIVVCDEHSYDLSIWFRNYAEMDDSPFRIEVFKSLTEANKWLE
ncbi:MAG: hypothetical protein HUN04_06095 [Desulfobacter sp.]|nr:MAG: hypothetical protein HUN04_06095 [Desulfobacter sp.]